MAAENPGSVTTFANANKDIPEAEIIDEYSAQLAAYRTEVAEPIASIVLTPERLLLQKTLTQRSVEVAQN